MEPFLIELNELLVGTYQSIVEVEERMLRDLSNSRLTITEMHVLECIGQGAETGRTVSDIAQRLRITPPSATVSIKRLESKGYVVKDRCAADARRVYVRLTREGRRAEVAHRYFHRQMVRAIADTMDAAERRALLKGIKKLDAFLKGKAASAGQEQSERSTVI